MTKSCWNRKLTCYAMFWNNRIRGTWFAPCWVWSNRYDFPIVVSKLNTDFVFSQHKQRCVALEEQLVALVVVAMERSEADTGESSHWLWLHLSSQLIYFVLFQFASFPTIVMALHEKVCCENFVLGFLFLFFFCSWLGGICAKDAIT